MNKAQPITRSIKNCRFSRLFKGCSPLQLLCNSTENRPQSATFHTAKRYKQAEKKDNDTMTMKFLLHKDKENVNPPHIQAHLAAPTHRRPLRSQRSLHFAYAPMKDSDLFE